MYTQDSTCTKGLPAYSISVMIQVVLTDRSPPETPDWSLCNASQSCFCPYTPFPPKHAVQGHLQEKYSCLSPQLVCCYMSVCISKRPTPAFIEHQETSGHCSLSILRLMCNHLFYYNGLEYRLSFTSHFKFMFFFFLT